MIDEVAKLSRYVVVAEFLVQDEFVASFASLMMRHARLSLGEPGCDAFEVCQDVVDPRKFMLFERYRDEEAYTAHRATAYYARFRDVAPAMLVHANGEMFHRRSVLRSIV